MVTSSDEPYEVQVDFSKLTKKEIASLISNLKKDVIFEYKEESFLLIFQSSNRGRSINLETGVSSSCCHDYYTQTWYNDTSTSSVNFSLENHVFARIQILLDSFAREAGIQKVTSFENRHCIAEYIRESASKFESRLQDILASKYINPRLQSIYRSYAFHNSKFNGVTHNMFLNLDDREIEDIENNSGLIAAKMIIGLTSEPTSVIKTEYKLRGLSSGGWSYLLKSGTSFLDAATLSRIILTLNILSKIGASPDNKILLSIANDCYFQYDHGLAKNLERRLIEINKWSSNPVFYTSEILPRDSVIDDEGNEVHRFKRVKKANTFDFSNPEHTSILSTLSSYILVSKPFSWAIDQMYADNGLDGMTLKSWNCPDIKQDYEIRLDSRIYKFNVKPLLNTVDLYKEGTYMGSCIGEGDYSYYSSQNAIRCFSVTGDDRASFSITINDNEDLDHDMHLRRFNEPSTRVLNLLFNEVKKELLKASEGFKYETYKLEEEDED